MKYLSRTTVRNYRKTCPRNSSSFVRESVYPPCHAVDRRSCPAPGLRYYRIFPSNSRFACSIASESSPISQWIVAEGAGHNEPLTYSSLEHPHSRFTGICNSSTIWIPKHTEQSFFTSKCYEQQINTSNLPNELPSGMFQSLPAKFETCPCRRLPVRPRTHNLQLRRPMDPQIVWLQARCGH